MHTRPPIFNKQRRVPHIYRSPAGPAETAERLSRLISRKGRKPESKQATNHQRRSAGGEHRVSNTPDRSISVPKGDTLLRTVIKAFFVSDCKPDGAKRQDAVRARSHDSVSQLQQSVGN